MSNHALESGIPELSLTAREALYTTGHGLFVQGRFGEAAEVFRMLLQLAPTDERGWLALGACHEEIDQEGVALELYRAGLTAAVDPFHCALACGRLLRLADREDEAEDAFQQACQIAERCGDAALLQLVDAERNKTS